jgi:hypothetical protein
MSVFESHASASCGGHAHAFYTVYKMRVHSADAERPPDVSSTPLSFAEGMRIMQMPRVIREAV